jgi:hypothetical protein
LGLICTRLGPRPLTFFLSATRRRGSNSTKLNQKSKTYLPTPSMALFIAPLAGALPCVLGALVGEENNVTSYPAKVELDVVFPGNNTYAPAEVFPIIFALQGWPAALPSTMLGFGWSLAKLDGVYIAGDDSALPYENSLEGVSDPHYVKQWTAWLSEAESAGTYVLAWEFTYTYCPGFPPDLTAASIKDSLYFTIEPGAQQPNLGADLETCPAKHTTIGISDTQPFEWQMQFSPPRSVCSLIAHLPPPGNPCAVRLDQAAASSIAAELTASACAIPSSETVFPSSCPPSAQTTEKSPGWRVAVWTGPGMLMGVTVAGLLLYVSL